MYVCVCNAVTEREIYHAIDGGAVTVQQLKDKLKVTTSCGACQSYIESVLEKKTLTHFATAEVA